MSKELREKRKAKKSVSLASTRSQVELTARQGVDLVSLVLWQQQKQ